MFWGLVAISFAQSDYYLKKAQNYQREAEYYQKKADGYRQNATYYFKKAEGYQRDAAYYTKRGDLDVRILTHVMQRMKWINTKPNFVMRHKPMIKPQHIFVGLRMH